MTGTIDKTLLQANRENKLFRLEQEIELAFYVTGRAFKIIRDERLWEGQYATLDDYLLQRWQYKDTSIMTHFIQAAETFELVETLTGIKLRTKNQTLNIRKWMKDNVPLEDYPELLQLATIYCQQHGVHLAPRILKASYNVLQEKRATGYVDIGDGYSTAIDAAITAEEYETVQRQQQIIRDKSRWIRAVDPIETTAGELRRQFSVPVFALSSIEDDKRIKVIIMVEKEDEKSALPHHQSGTG